VWGVGEESVKRYQNEAVLKKLAPPDKKSGAQYTLPQGRIGSDDVTLPISRPKFFLEAFYLHTIDDVYSCKIVGGIIYQRER
jgi:hypothetical protein